MPYDLVYLKALGKEALARRGAVVWPGIYAVDVLAKPRYYDDSRSRRELTWSPSVGSFEQEMPHMATYVAGLADRPAARVTSSVAEPGLPDDAPTAPRDDLKAPERAPIEWPE